MRTFKFTGPEPQAILRDPKGVFPDIPVRKGQSFGTDDRRVIELASELPAFEEVKDEPKPKKSDGKS